MHKGYASHGFPALYDETSTILILGSFPSVKSREQGFYYGHKQNRFWKMLSGCFQEETPSTIDEKRAFCHRHRIALYDSIESCEIEGSSDASIKNVVPADLKPIFSTANIRLVIFNGNASEKWFYKYQSCMEGVRYATAPSTSAANASWNLEKLMAVWGQLLK